MKTLSWISVMFIVFSLSDAVAQKAQADKGVTVENSTKADGPVATFDKTVFDFGTLVQSIPGTASFTLTNEGTAPLVIASAKASCGCTNLTYAKDPILPGKSVAISVTYNAAALGNFMKTITVTTNAGEQPVVLQIKGSVEAKKEAGNS